MIKKLEFAAEYAVDQNATQAAIRASYSKRTAYSQGSRLLKDPDVRVEIETEQNRHAQRVDVQVDEVVAGLKTIAKDCLAPAAARVSAWKALGEYKGMFATGVRDVPPQVISLLETLRRQDQQTSV
jgi:phage terminase small subunit